MQCKPSKLPDKLSFVRATEGRRVYNDGNTVIIVTTHTTADGSTESMLDFLFYQGSLSMFARSEGLRIKVGDFLIYFPCGEVLFQMIKAAKFEDWTTFWEIYRAESVKSCKALGHSVKSFKQDEWVKVSADVMAEVARLKITCPDVFNCFCALDDVCCSSDIDWKNVRFTECSAKDNIYGIGVSVEEAADKLLTADIDAVFDRDFLLGKGANVLGKAYDSAFSIFLACGGKEALDVYALASRYEEFYDKNFYETLLEVGDDMNKKAKTQVDMMKTPELKTDMVVPETPDLGKNKDVGDASDIDTINPPMRSHTIAEADYIGRSPSM